MSTDPSSLARPDVVEVVVTGPDEEMLAGLIRALVEERLVACGQISGGVRAIYRWEGAVEDEPQARARLHTRAALVPALAARIRAGHPDDVPCVLAVPIAGGDRDYLAWVVEETRDPADDVRA